MPNQCPYCPEKVNGKYHLDCRIQYLEEQRKEDAERTLDVLRGVPLVLRVQTVAGTRKWFCAFCDGAGKDTAEDVSHMKTVSGIVACIQPELAGLIAYWEGVKLMNKDSRTQPVRRVPTLAAMKQTDAPGSQSNQGRQDQAERGV